MIILGAVMLFLGGFLVFVAVLRRDFGLGAMGTATALLAVGIFFRVRAAGYLLAAGFSVITAMRAFDAIRAGAIDGRTMFQIVLGALAAWKCWAWAQEQVTASTNSKPKPKPLAPRPMPGPATSQPASIQPPSVSEPADASPAVPAGKFVWVWVLALGSFIPFGLGVWYFTGRESRPAPKPVTTPVVAKPVPKPPPPVKEAGNPSSSQPAPTPKPVAKAESPLPPPKSISTPPPSRTNSATPASTATALASPPPWKIPGTQPARIEVRNMKLVPLVVSTNALGWEEVPPVFRERRAQIMALTVPADVETGAAEYTVRSAGYAIIACNFGYQGNNSGGWQASRWQPSDFVANGWTSIPQAELGGFLTSVDVHRVQVLFWKNLTAGETGRIRCNKYYPPYFILLGEP